MLYVNTPLNLPITFQRSSGEFWGRSSCCESGGDRLMIPDSCEASFTGNMGRDFECPFPDYFKEWLLFMATTRDSQELKSFVDMEEATGP